MKKIIRISPVETNTLRITYVMNTQCTYSCRYCDPKLHTGKNRYINIDEIKEFLKRFKDRNIVIDVTGGEPTIHPQFEEIITELHSMNIKLIVNSNGVRTRRFFEQYAGMVDNWCISLHPSQLEELDVEKIKIAAEKSFVVVYVLIDPAHFEKALGWYDQLKSVDNIRLNAFRVLGVDYTEEQEEILKGIDGTWNFTKEREEALQKTHSWLSDLGTLGFYDDGTSSALDFAEVLRNNQHNFRGWKCSTGNESIQIFEDGSAKWANCGIIEYNHFTDIDPEELKKPVVCKYDWCLCGTDIRGSKQSPDIQE